MKPNKLTDELLSAGASEGEARELAQLALSLSHLNGTEPKLAGRAGKRVWWRAKLGLWPVLGTALVGLAAGTAVVAIAQTAIPGGPLYPVKRASERIAATVQPDYRTTIMMHRAQEVRILVAEGQNSRLVTAALADYKADMRGLKTNNYAALDYCHSNLLQAEAIAPPAEKQQIATVLSELNQDKE